MNLSKLTIIFMILLFSYQSTASTTSSGYWVGIFPTYEIDKTQNLSIQAEIRSRGNDNFMLFRPAYHRKVLPWLKWGAGGDLFTKNKVEGRIWQEVSMSTNKKLLGQIFQSRFRQEARQLSGVGRIGWRTRVMVASSFSIIEKLSLTGTLFNEAFYSELDFNGRNHYVDRNWLGGRFSYKAKKIHYDLGIFWERVFSSRDIDSTVGIFSVGGDFF